MSVIRFARTPPLPPSPTGRFRAGAASVDVTPAWGLAMAGYATEGERAWGFQGRLRARALYFEDARGERAAVVAADLHAASRYLLERVALETAPACGISVDRLLLAGTHTHTAPGNFYGNTLFDSTAQRSMGFDQGYADWVSGRIAAAVKRAASAARPATVGFGTRTLWGVSRNRSLTPFLANDAGTAVPAGIRSLAGNPRVGRRSVASRGAGRRRAAAHRGGAEGAVPGIPGGRTSTGPAG